MTEEEKKSLPVVYETAFWLHSNSFLNVKSSSFYHFDSFVYSEDYGSINIEKSVFSDSRSHSINLINPLLVNVLENTFERSQKSSISVKFLKHNRQKGSVLSNTSPIISVKQNNILRGSSYGLSIFGEDTKLKEVAISISRNTFEGLKKDAIGIKFLNYNYLKISGNVITRLNGNGIYLMQIRDPRQNSNAILKKNKITHCEQNGIVIKNSYTKHESNTIYKNKKNGVLIVFDSNADSLNSTINQIDSYSTANGSLNLNQKQQ
mmetsp:Transcript_37820/g.33850  ORF Transcript_37820/g.33850 Transcript_37820/m.33850 type:complete len:263 (-) Transcript_37820:695-1483(-)